MSVYSYAIWLLVFLICPNIALWALFGKTLKRYIHVILVVTVLTLFGLVWDFWGVHYGIWSFPAGHNLGIYIAGLPIEEYSAFVLFALFVSSLTIVFRFHGHLKIDRARR